MAFASELFGVEVIDNATANQLSEYVRQNEGMGGYVPRDFNAVPFGSVSPIYRGSVIDRSEWKERIEEREKTQSSLRHLQRYLKMPVLNQKDVPYCWAYGTVKSMMYGYGMAGYNVPHLSATSLAAKVTNYQKRGWWASAATEGTKKYGVSTLEYWPDAAVDRRYDTAEQRANAMLHQAVEYEELPSNSFAHLVTSLLLNFPTTMGLTWWGHLVCGVRAVVLINGQIGIEIDNSWGSDWGTNGAGILTEEKATAFEQFCVRTVTLRNAA